MRHRSTALTVGALVLALGAGACAGSGGTEAASQTPSASALSKAATLRASLDAMFAEHVTLAAAATNAALGGRTAEFEAAAAVLTGRNANDLAAAVGSVYGKKAQDAFLPLWNEHIGFFVDYTTAVATKDGAKQQKAVDDLTAYTQEFGAFLNSANPNLPKGAVADLVLERVLTLKAVVDAQAAKDWGTAYRGLVDAIHHMDMIGAALADAIAKQKGF